MQNIRYHFLILFDFPKYIVAPIRVYILKLFPDAFKDCKINLFYYFRFADIFSHHLE